MGKCRSWGQTINLQSTIIRKKGEERKETIGCSSCCCLFSFLVVDFVVCWLFCCIVVLLFCFGCLGNNRNQRKTTPKNKNFIESFIFVCWFGFVVCLGVFFVLLDSCFCFDCCFDCCCCCCCCCCCFVVLLFRLVWGTPTKDNTTFKTTKPLILLCFLHYCV